MATVTFTLPDAIATELNAIGVAEGYTNAKVMTIAYLTRMVRASRLKAAITAVSTPNMDDVVIT